MLEVSDLSVARGRVQVVWGVSLVVPAGSIVALLGPNGAGKTTTLECVAGLRAPLAGAVTYQSASIGGWLPHDLVEQGVSLVPSWRGAFSKMTVRENLELGAFTTSARPFSEETMQFVFGIFPRLAERREQIAGTLSGGERKMLAIGRALMARPRLLMLDEPSLGLAPLVLKRILDVLRAINEQGVTILLVEQNVRLALELAQYAYVMESGRIVHEGTARSLLKDSRVQQAYLSL